MKRLILLATAVSVIGLGHSAMANEQPPAAPEDAPIASTAPSSVIDGIEIPYGVLNSIQLEYQGYAVTKAYKQMRGSSTFYLLQVSKDTQALPHESMFLLFDKDWKFTTQQAAPAAPAPPKKVEVPKPAQQEPAQPAPVPEVQQQPVRQQEEGGRGAGGVEDDDDNDKPVDIKPGNRGGRNAGGNED